MKKPLDATNIETAWRNGERSAESMGNFTKNEEEGYDDCLKDGAYREIERRLGKNPTKEQLWEECARLQFQLWKTDDDVMTALVIGAEFNEGWSRVTHQLQSENADYLKQAFQEVPSGDVSDGLYPLRRIENALKMLELWKSSPTTKRLLKVARERGIIPRFEEENKQTRLTREDLWAFVQFIEGKK